MRLKESEHFSEGPTKVLKKFFFFLTSHRSKKSLKNFWALKKIFFLTKQVEVKPPNKKSALQTGNSRQKTNVLRFWTVWRHSKEIRNATSASGREQKEVFCFFFAPLGHPQKYQVKKFFFRPPVDVNFDHPKNRPNRRKVSHRGKYLTKWTPLQRPRRGSYVPPTDTKG